MVAIALTGRMGQLCVLPEADHGHLHCLDCGETWEIDEGEAAALIAALVTDRGFTVELSHLSVSGRCHACSEHG